MKKTGIIISIVLPIVGLIGATGLFLQNMELIDERKKVNEAELKEAIAEVDRIVNRAIVHCETDEIGCDEIMLQWFEECKKENMKNIPSCHDGRIANYLSKEPTTISEQTTMSEECKEAKEIMEQNRWGANNNDPIALGEFGMAMNDYNRLGCP